MKRRHFLTGLTCLIAAPAIIRVAQLMPISVPRLIIPQTTLKQDIEAFVWSSTPRVMTTFTSVLCSRRQTHTPQGTLRAIRCPTGTTWTTSHERLGMVRLDHGAEP